RRLLAVYYALRGVSLLFLPMLLAPTVHPPMVSTRTDAPLGAVGGAVGLTIVGNVLDAVTALGHWRDFLPAHWQFAWVGVVQPRPEWSGMIQGTAVSVTCALVFFALAFRGFARKDVVS
ncbi:hypothetical protein ABT024_40800, partial [Streptomyces sp. NPDC002812]